MGKNSFQIIGNVTGYKLQDGHGAVTNIYIEPTDTSKGRITICYGNTAWTTFFDGATPNLPEFLIGLVADPDYLMDRLEPTKTYHHDRFINLLICQLAVAPPIKRKKDSRALRDKHSTLFGEIEQDILIGVKAEINELAELEFSSEYQISSLLGNKAQFPWIVSYIENLPELIADAMGYSKPLERFMREVYPLFVERLKLLLKCPIDHLGLSARAYNCLKRGGVNTLEDLVKQNKKELLRWRNFGKRSVIEVESILHERGFMFGMDLNKYLPLNQTE